MTSPPSLRTFVRDHVLDEGARVPAVLGRDSADVITPDRTLRDAALALLTLPAPDETDLTRRLLGALREFTDPDLPGFRELLDVTGAPHPIGDVRTPSVQALAAWALHRAGTLTGDETLLTEAESQLDHVVGAVLAHDWPARLDRSATAVLDESGPLAETAVLVLAADALTPATGSAFLDAAADRLDRYVHGDAVWDLLTPRGVPDTLRGHRTGPAALAALAWAALHRRGRAGAADRARRTLAHVHGHHQHVGTGGYWDRSSADSVVRVDAVAALHGRPDSPFPAKFVADHALLALAARTVAAFDDVDAEGGPVLKALAEEAEAELERNTDPVAGGVFHGQGSWFSTPVDPTVPLARHVMVPPRTTGSFAVGNTTYVPFHGKHARTQLLALAALGDRVVTPAPRRSSSSVRSRTRSTTTWDTSPPGGCPRGSSTSSTTCAGCAPPPPAWATASPRTGPRWACAPTAPRRPSRCSTWCPTCSPSASRCPTLPVCSPVSSPRRTRTAASANNPPCPPRRSPPTARC